MSVQVSISKVDGGSEEWEEQESLYHYFVALRREGYEGKKLVNELITEDWAVLPKSVRLSGTLEDGTSIDEYIPYR